MGAGTPTGLSYLAGVASAILQVYANSFSTGNLINVINCILVSNWSKYLKIKSKRNIMRSSIRIVATYENEKITTSSVERVEILALATEPLKDFNKLVGFWMELRTSLDKPIYRRIMRDPFRPEAEVFNLNEDKTVSGSMIHRNKIAGHLVLLVPDNPDASYVALVRSKVDIESKKLYAQDVIRIPIKIK